MNGVDSRMNKEFNNSGCNGKGSGRPDDDYAWSTLNSVGAFLRTIEFNSTSTLTMTTVLNN